MPETLVDAVSRIYGMKPNSNRLSILPNYTKSEGLIAPQFVYDMLLAAATPGYAYQGGDPTESEVMNTAMTMVGGATARNAMKYNPAKVAVNGTIGTNVAQDTRVTSITSLPKVGEPGPEPTLMSPDRFTDEAVDTKGSLDSLIESSRDPKRDRTEVFPVDLTKEQIWTYREALYNKGTDFAKTPESDLMHNELDNQERNINYNTWKITPEKGYPTIPSENVTNLIPKNLSKDMIEKLTDDIVQNRRSFDRDTGNWTEEAKKSLDELAEQSNRILSADRDKKNVAELANPYSYYNQKKSWQEAWESKIRDNPNSLDIEGTGLLKLPLPDSTKQLDNLLSGITNKLKDNNTEIHNIWEKQTELKIASDKAAILDRSRDRRLQTIPVFQGIHEIPVGTKIKARHAYTNNKPTIVTVVGNQSISYPDGVRLEPEVDFGDGRFYRISFRKIDEVYMPRSPPKK